MGLVLRIGIIKVTGMTDKEKIVIAPLIEGYKLYLADLRARSHNVKLDDELLRMNDPSDHKSYLMDFEIIRMVALETQTANMQSTSDPVRMAHPAFKNATREQIDILLKGRL